MLGGSEKPGNQICGKLVFTQTQHQALRLCEVCIAQVPIPAKAPDA